ncbi:MAG: outer membrane protein assembly factor BamA [Lentisphaeria bacterium]|nr:outer membrane protein assembly factor BamA [Lentisphaeria bacterium]
MTNRLMITKHVYALGVFALALVLGLGVRAEQVGRILVRSTIAEVDGKVLQHVVEGKIRTQVDTQFLQKVLSDDIKRLLKSGHFEDVRVEVNEMDGGRLEIVFNVEPKRMVRSIVYEGNRKFKEKKLAKLTTHESDVPLDRILLAADAKAIRDKYQAVGFYGARVTVEPTPIENSNDVKVVFHIDEGARAKLRKVRFAGNTAYTERELRKIVHTRRRWYKYIFRWGNHYNKHFEPIDTDLLHEKYLGKGFLDFEVEEVEKTFDAKRKWVTLTYRLAEGMPYRISEITLEGCNRFSSEELMPRIRQKPGEVYSSVAEGKDTKRLRRKYEPLGYLDLRCWPVHTRNSVDHTVAIKYRFLEGEICRIRDVHIVGNETTKDHVIRRELNIQPGDLGDAGKIRVSKSLLENLDYFDKVEITSLATESAALRDLRISLEEKRTGQLMMGVGFSSDDSVVGYVEVAQRNFDLLNWPSFRGGGQRMRVRVSAGTDTQSVVLAFTEPWFLHRRLRLDVNAYHGTIGYDEYDQTSTSLEAIVTKPWLKHWKQSYGLRVSQTEIDEYEKRDLSDILYAELEDENKWLANGLIFRLTRDTRNRFIFPSSGSRLNFNSRFVTQALGSYSNYAKFDIQGAKYIPVFKDMVFKVHADLGIAAEISGDDIAPFDRYYAGGINSVRGFERRTVGPVGDLDHEDPLGGKARLLGGLELIKPLATWIRVSLFTDVGNVWGEVGDLDPAEMNVSVGVGMHLQLPIGPIRLDYGYPVATDQKHLDGKGGEFHFNLGYSF